MSTQNAHTSIPALIVASEAAARLGVGIKRFKTAVAAGQMGGMWLVELGDETYVHRAYLDAFIAGKPAPKTPADLFSE